MAKEKVKPEQKKERDYHGRFLPGHTPLWIPPEGNNYASKYKEEYCEQIVEYFLNPPREKYIDADGNEKEGAQIYPTFERFAANIGVISETLEEWTKRHERFRIAYSYAKNIQRSILVAKGLSGEYNPTFAKFIASTTHGMVEKSALDLGNADSKPFEVNINVVDKVGG